MRVSFPFQAYYKQKSKIMESTVTRLIHTTCTAKNSLEGDLEVHVSNIESIVLASSLNGIVAKRCGIEMLDLERRTSQQTDTCACVRLGNDELTIVTCPGKKRGLYSVFEQLIDIS